MAEIFEMKADTRERAGKGTARALRRTGFVPAVVYGDKKDPLLISIDGKSLNRELSKKGFFTRQYDIAVDGDKQHVLPRDVQFDPVSDAPIHVDFLRVTAATKIKVSIEVSFINEEESPGLKRGGVINVVRHEIEVLCSVANIPERFVIDLTGLDIGDSVHVSKLGLPEDVQPTITDRDFTIATIAAPTIQEEEVPEEEEGIEGEEGEEGEAAEGAEGAGEGEGSKGKES